MRAMAYEHIKKLLLDNGQEQADLAKLLGRTNAVVTNLFNGSRSLQIEEVQKISERYGVSTDFVLYGRERYEGNLRDSEIAITDAFKVMMQIMLYHGMAKPESFTNAFSYQCEEYREKDMPNAMVIMNELIQYAGGTVQPGREILKRLLQLRPLGTA